MTIPVLDPAGELQLVRRSVDDAIRRTLDGGRYILGTEVSAFESEFAAWLGVSEVVGVASGTDALTLALRATGVEPGDEVITVSHTAVATVVAIARAGAVPVLVDVDPRTLTLDPSTLEDALTPRTRAVVPVHLYGNAADLDGIAAFAAAHGLVVVEDCAQAHGTLYDGRHVGASADAAAFSFYPTKTLGGLGDGGAIACRNAETAERARLLRQYGWRQHYVSSLDGWNSRLDELQAAVLRVKLRHLDAFVARRRAIAERYRESLGHLDLELPAVTERAVHSYHLFVVRSAARDALSAHLQAQGIGTGVHYPVPVHRQPAYADLAARARLRVTEEAAATVLSLPIGVALSDDAVDRVVAAVSSFAPTPADRH